MKFDVGAIPSSAVTSASLNLYFLQCFPTVSYPNSNCPFVFPYYDTSFALRSITGAWSGSTTAGDGLWATTLAGGVVASASTHVGWDGDQPQIWKTWSGWSLATLVGNWVSGATANNGLLLTQATEGAELKAQTSCGLSFASSEWSDSSFRPRLDVTWSGDGVTLFQPLSLHGNGADLVWDQNPAPTGTFKRYEVPAAPRPQASARVPRP